MHSRHIADRVSVCAVVPAANEAGAIANVLRQLHRSGAISCIVVANGCSDDTVRIADAVGPDLFARFCCLCVANRLGHDVGRAVGALAALRRWQNVEWLLFVDGDWQGSFGPALADFVQAGQRQSGVHWLASGNTARMDVPGEQLWRSAAISIFPDRPTVARIRPSLLPMLVHRSALRLVPLFWLHHPALWAAWCALQPALPLSVDRTFDVRLCGDSVRSRQHHLSAAATMMGDAVEAVAVLSGRPRTRTWQGQYWDGWHGQRRVEWLLHWQSGIKAQIPAPYGGDDRGSQLLV